MLSRLTINTNHSCNLECLYCYAGGGEYGRKLRGIDEQKVITSLTKIVQKHDTITLVQFIGGEPLLNLPAIRTICKVVNNFVKEGLLKKQPEFGIVTNLTVLTEKHLEVLKEFDISITVSIDGPNYIHDQLRVKKRNHTGTHAIIVKNLSSIQAKNISFDFETTYTRVHLANKITFVNLLEYFSNWKPNRIDITPVSVSEKSDLGFKNEEDQKLVAKHQLDALNYSLDHLSEGCVVPYGHLIEIINLLKSESSNDFCPAGKTNLAIASDGVVYGCHMFTNKHQYLIEEFGNNTDQFLLYDKPVSEQLTVNEPSSNSFPIKSIVKECTECWAVKWCRACLGNMEIRSPGKPLPLGFNCELIKRSIELVIQRLPTIIDNFNLLTNEENKHVK